MLQEVTILKALIQQCPSNTHIAPHGHTNSRTSQEVDLLLSILHAGDVVVQGDQVRTGLGGVEAEQLGQAVAVAGVLDDSQLDGAAESSGEGGELLAIVGGDLLVLIDGGLFLLCKETKRGGSKLR